MEGLIVQEDLGGVLLLVDGGDEGLGLVLLPLAEEVLHCLLLEDEDCEEDLSEKGEDGDTDEGVEHQVSGMVVGRGGVRVRIEGGYSYLFGDEGEFDNVGKYDSELDGELVEDP